MAKVCVLDARNKGMWTLWVLVEGECHDMVSIGKPRRISVGKGTPAVAPICDMVP